MAWRRRSSSGRTFHGTTSTRMTMTRNQMIAKIALEIATQAVESGRINVDLTWLDTAELLNTIEEDMSPKNKWDEEH